MQGGPFRSSMNMPQLHTTPTAAYPSPFMNDDDKAFDPTTRLHQTFIVQKRLPPADATYIIASGRFEQVYSA